MKKLMSIFACLSLSLFLVGCGDGKKKEETKKDSKTETKVEKKADGTETKTEKKEEKSETKVEKKAEKDAK